jgi:hypothetical protein
MRRLQIICFITIIVLVAAGCSIISGGKPGTGGKNSGDAIKKTAHPDIPTGVRCYVCHKSDIPQAAFHKAYGRECEQCHGLDTWIASKYPHEKWQLGIHRQMQCVRCHTAIESYDFSVWQCWGCHHDQIETIASHKKMGYNDIANCLACHKGTPESAQIPQSK